MGWATLTWSQVPWRRGPSGASSDPEPPNNVAPIFQVGERNIFLFPLFFVAAFHVVLDALSPGEGSPLLHAPASVCSETARESTVSSSPQVSKAQGII